MTRTLTELLKDYKNSIETALAAEIEQNEDPSDDAIEDAKQITKQMDLDDYNALSHYLNDEEYQPSAEEGEEPEYTDLEGLLAKYGVDLKHVSESDYLDRDIMMREGFEFFGVFEDEKLRGRITRFLDENEIDYMDDGSGHVQMRFGDRESAYRVEEQIARMMRQNDPHFMRDHKEQFGMLDEFNIFDSGKPKRTPEVVRKIPNDHILNLVKQFRGSGKSLPRDIQAEYDRRRDAGELDERAPNRNKDGSLIDQEPEEPQLMSFEEFRKAHPEIKNHSRAKRAYKSWCGTQKPTEISEKKKKPSAGNTGSPPARFMNQVTKPATFKDKKKDERKKAARGKLNPRDFR